MEKSTCPNALSIKEEDLSFDYVYIKSESSDTLTTKIKDDKADTNEEMYRLCGIKMENVTSNEFGNRSAEPNGYDYSTLDNTELNSLSDIKINCDIFNEPMQHCEQLDPLSVSQMYKVPPYFELSHTSVEYENGRDNVNTGLEDIIKTQNKSTLSKFRRIQVVNYKEGEGEKPNIDSNDPTTVICFKNKIDGPLVQEAALYMGYKYILKKYNQNYREWSCQTSKCFAKIIIFTDNKSLSLIDEHTCNKTKKIQNLTYRSIVVKDYLKESLPRTPLKRKNFLTNFVPPDPYDSKTVTYYYDENGIKIGEYMGHKYLIKRTSTHTSTKWKCQNYISCSATLVVAQDQTSALLGGKHTCDQLNKSDSQVLLYKGDNSKEMVIEMSTSNKAETGSIENDILSNLKTENKYDSGSVIKIESCLQEEITLNDDTIKDVHDNSKYFNCNSYLSEIKPDKVDAVVTTTELSKSGEFNMNDKNDRKIMSVPNRKNFIKSDNRKVKGLIPVKIIDHLSDIEPKLKPVPLEDQSTYELLNVDHNLLFNGYSYFKSDYSFIDGTIIYLCANRLSKTCPGEVRMQENKLLKSYTEHWCNRSENSDDKNAFPDSDDPETLLLYNNSLTFQAEALYQGFIYEKSSEKEYHSVWKCAKNKPNSNTQVRGSNCKALLKVFPMTSLLMEVGNHICVSNKVENETAKNELENNFQSKNNILLTLITNNKEMFNKSMLPKFLDKKLIPVVHEKDGNFLIYNGFMYFRQASMVNTIYFLCYNSETFGCSGKLTVNAGKVKSVSRHDCFKKMKENNNFLIFQGKRSIQYAMYKGYIYKKCSYPLSQNVYRWNCQGGRVHCCDSILTTENDKIISVLRHSCREEDDDGREEETTCMINEPKTKKRRTEPQNELNNSIKAAFENLNKVEETIVKTEYQANDDFAFLDPEEIRSQS